jgi:DNA-binding PadR family transcriptional regulator
MSVPLTLLGLLEREPSHGYDLKREQGATEFEEWLAEPVEAEPHLQTVLFAKVVLALMLGRDAERCGHERD